MKICDAIARAGEVLSIGTYDDGTIIDWLSNLDANIYNELMTWHEDAPAESPGPYSGAGDDLLVPEPYSAMYADYLMAVVHMKNADYDRYDNAMQRFTTAYEAYATYYNRVHKPLQNNTVRI